MAGTCLTQIKIQFSNISWRLEKLMYLPDEKKKMNLLTSIHFNAPRKVSVSANNIWKKR